MTNIGKKLPTNQEMNVFDILIGGHEMYGYEIVERSNGTLKKTSIYVVLARMVARGFLTARDGTEDDGTRRVFYKITAYGQQMYDVARTLEQTMDAELAKHGVAKPSGTL